MQNLLLFIAITSLWQWVTATENATAYPVLEPVSDEGWTNILVRRLSPEDYLKLADSEHFVWSSASGKRHFGFSQ